MTIKNYLSLVYGVVFTILYMGCENPTVITEPVNIIFRPQFIIENDASTTKTVSLKKAYHYNNVWDVISKAGLEANSPVNVEVPPGEDGTLETWTSIRADIVSPMSGSFVLTIDDKHYVGWEAATDSGDLEGIVEYRLGYVNVTPGEINPSNPGAVLMSKLMPKLLGYRLDKSSVTALYGVKITDEGVSFTLYKQSADYQW
ncbi:MAG: hypothetical protein LBU16_06970 [Treponema sp.]|jgi:hypothetical protein|nr:hypothetical protein [Treponema sp.]